MVGIRPQGRRRSVRRPLALAAIGGAVLVMVGAGVWATLSATAFNTTPQQVTTGTLELTMADNGVGFSQAITNMAPGDVVNRYVNLTNGGTLDAQALTLQVAATGSPALITDGSGGVTTKALHVTITSCSGSWAPTTGVCTGTPAVVMASTVLSALSTTPVAVGSGVFTATAVQHLQVSVQLPDQAEVTINGTLPTNTIQGLSAYLTYTFAEAQRTATLNHS
jgi:hypothetical protein